MTWKKKVKEEGLWVEHVDFELSVLPKDANLKQVVRYKSYRIQEEPFSVRYLFRSYMFKKDTHKTFDPRTFRHFFKYNGNLYKYAINVLFHKARLKTY